MTWLQRIGRAISPPLFVLLAGTALRAAPPKVLALDAALAADNTVVAVGERGLVLRSADHAQSWTTAPSGVGATLTAVAFAPGADSRTGWAVGHEGVVLATTDAGANWRRQFPEGGDADSFLDVIALDAKRVLAVGAYGLFAASNDGGATWQRRKIRDDDYHFNRVTRGPAGTLYLAGERGTLLKSADDGATWQPIAAPYEGSFYGILPLDRRTLVAHGLRGHVFRSADDGATWQPAAIEAPVLLATALRLKSNFLIVGGHARTLWLSRDYGVSFKPVPAAPTTAVAEYLELGDGAVLAVGEAGVQRLELSTLVPEAAAAPAAPR